MPARSRSARASRSQSRALPPTARELVDAACPPTSTARDSGRSRAPSHTGHGAQRHVLLDLLARRAPSRSRRSGAGGWRRCRGTAPRTSAGARSGCGSAPATRSPGAVQEQVALLVWQILPRACRGRRRSARDRLGHLLVVVRRAARPRRSAPSLIDSDGSGTTSSGSISICEPRPVQAGQAPCGELNEKMRGSSSTSDGPCRAREALGEGEQRPRLRRPPGTICAARGCARPTGRSRPSPPLSGAESARRAEPRSRSRSGRRPARPPSRSSPPGACARRGA